MQNGTTPGNSTVAATGCGEVVATSAASADFWIGVCSAIAGSLTLNLGINIQKLAFVRRAALPVRVLAVQGGIYRNPLWVFGLIIFLIGNAGDAVGLTFTAQSVITPLGSVSLVSNVFFAWLLVREKLDRATTFGTGLIIVGVICTVTSGNNKCTSFTLDTLIARFSQAGFIVFAICHVSSMIALLRFIFLKEKRMAAGGGGILVLTPMERTRLRLAYPLAGSLFAAWTVLLVKSFGELLKESVRSGESQFRRYESWLIVCAIFMSFPMQFLFIQKGLQFFDAMYIVPVFSSSWTMGSVIMGALFWGEFSDFKGSQFFLFFAGIGIITLGIFLLQQRSVKVAPPEESEMEMSTQDRDVGEHDEEINSESRIDIGPSASSTLRVTNTLANLEEAKPEEVKNVAGSVEEAKRLRFQISQPPPPPGPPPKASAVIRPAVSTD